MPLNLPPLQLLWLEAGVLGLGGFIVCLRWPRVAAVVVPLAVVLGLWQHIVLLQPSVGTAVVLQEGDAYLVRAHLAHFILLGLPLLGLLLQRWQTRAWKR